MLLLEGPRRRLKGSKETSTKLCVMKRLLSIAEATAHEITPGDYAKKKEVLQRQRGWAQGSRTASSGIWPPHCNTTFGSQTSGQNGPAWRWPLQSHVHRLQLALDSVESRLRVAENRLDLLEQSQQGQEARLRWVQAFLERLRALFRWML